MAPFDVKQSFLTPSLKLMVYLMIVENFTWTKPGRFWLPFSLILDLVGDKSNLRHPHFQVPRKEMA